MRPIACVRCGSESRPLKWYNMWKAWYCYQCLEVKIAEWSPR